MHTIVVADGMSKKLHHHEVAILELFSLFVSAHFFIRFTALAKHALAKAAFSCHPFAKRKRLVVAKEVMFRFNQIFPLG